MSVSELETATSLNPKTIGSRLSELNKAGAVEQVETPRAQDGTRSRRPGSTGCTRSSQKKFPRVPQASPA